MEHVMQSQDNHNKDTDKIASQVSEQTTGSGTPKSPLKKDEQEQTGNPTGKFKLSIEIDGQDGGNEQIKESNDEE